MSVRNVWAYKRRLIGTIVAVVIGVAFLSGTLLLSDTMATNFDQLFARANGSTDVVVRSTTEVGSDARQNRRAGIDATLVDTVAKVDGVAVAEPYITGTAQLLDHNGKAIGGNGPPTRAANWSTTASLNP